MINYESLAIARLMSRNSSKWTESVRRTAGQLALRAGQRRTAAQVLTRLVNLVNARTEDGTLRQRCELALEDVPVLGGGVEVAEEQRRRPRGQMLGEEQLADGGELARAHLAR